MKRLGNLYNNIISIENLRLADQKARKGKGSQYGVQLFDKNPESNLLLLHEMLLNKTFSTSEYSTFKVYEPKERLVFRLPYFPDRIVHHAVMNIMEPVFTSLFTADTFSCIKGRGIHAAAEKLKTALQDKQNTKYCLKLDIVKFYPNVNHNILKSQLRRKLKDQDLLFLLDEIIDSADGLPIGNYLSQYLANFYLTGLDHFIKEKLKAKYYFRYADDLVILSGSKSELHAMLSEIREYLTSKLALKVKNNYQVFPVQARGIDFIGYVFYHTHTLLRKTIKQNYARAVARNAPENTIASYNGWAVHANTFNLTNKLHHERHKKFLRVRDKSKN